MAGYTVTGRGEKIHLRDIREVYTKNGVSKVRYRRRESNFAPYKTSCGRYDNGRRSFDMMGFFEEKKKGSPICQKCLIKYSAVIKESRKQRARQ